MLLKTMAIGRLAKKPELRNVEIGGQQVPVTDFRIAVNIGYGDNERTEWMTCIAWRKLAEIIVNFGDKGRLVYIEGQPKTRKYTIDKDGVSFEREVTEIVLDNLDFLDKANKTQEASSEVNPFN